MLKGVAIFGCMAMLSAQEAPKFEFRYLYTFGSKQGIHLPKSLNRKPATVALGQDEHPYGLGFPVAVTTDARHRVWITDSGTNSVHVFDPSNGKYREFHQAGDAPFRQPSGIASDPVGRVYVADAGSGDVVAFDESGEFNRSLLSKRGRVLESPTLVALSEDSRTIFVADPPAKKIVALDREGEPTGVIGPYDQLSDPGAMEVIENQLYVLDNRSHKIVILAPGGQIRGELQWDDIRYPAAFVYSASWNLFLVADPRWTVVSLVDGAGHGYGAFGQAGDGVDQMRRIDAIHIDDAKGVAYVVDSRRGKVLVFSISSSAPVETSRPSRLGELKSRTTSE